MKRHGREKEQGQGQRSSTFSASAAASNSGRWNWAGAGTALAHALCHTLLLSSMRPESLYEPPVVLPTVVSSLTNKQSFGECHRTKSMRSLSGFAAWDRIIHQRETRGAGVQLVNRYSHGDADSSGHHQKGAHVSVWTEAGTVNSPPPLPHVCENVC